MCRKLVFIISFVAVLGVSFTSPASADLVAWWRFDDGSDTTATDSSGNGYDGTLLLGPQWVAGKHGGALEFAGTVGQHVEIYGYDGILGTQNRTAMAWIKTTGYGDWISWGQNVNTQKWIGRINDNAGNGAVGALRTECSGGYIISTTVLTDGEWHHATAVLESAGLPTVENITMYVDGIPEAISGVNPIGIDTVGGRNVWIGDGHHDRPLPSLIDDVRLYDHAMTQAEIQQAMLGTPPGAASNPSPADKATDVLRDVVLSWAPGEFAPAVNGHIVHLSESFNDVNDGIGGMTQSATSHDPGRLAFETTYYWRVDEVNAPPDSTVYPGDVWSFATEPIGYPIGGASITATASSSAPGNGPENAVNGSGLSDDLHSTVSETMWLSGPGGPQPTWIQFEFDKVYALHEMWVWNSNTAIEASIGFGTRDVSVEYSIDGIDYVTLGTTHEFAQAIGADGYAHNTTVDLGGLTAKYLRLAVNSNWGGFLPQYGLSEVRFFSIPLSAREPSPDSGATDVDVDVTLSWRAGREAATHVLYLSADEQAVIDGNTPAVNLTDPSYNSALDLGNTYYWRVDEVNDAKTPTIWQGDVWSFTTQEFIVVDDFESYNDIDPPDPKSNRIFESWPDGFGNTANGALVGYDPPQPSYAEKAIVHGGAQSMPMFYSNTLGATFSEATRTFAAQDWTAHGVTTLGLWFFGTAGNTGQMYVKINGTKITSNASLALEEWQPWTIDLASSGANLQSVSSLSIGVDGFGASGTLYVDDIGLYGN